MKDRFVLAYHGEEKNAYQEEIDLVYRNFLLLDRHENALVIEGEFDQLESFLSRYNLKSWVIFHSHSTSPVLWSKSFPKKDTTNCKSCGANFQPLWFDDERKDCYNCDPLDYKYDQAYPNAVPGESPEVDLRKSSDVDNCGECSSPTQWISTLFGVGVPTCSKHCTDSMWKAYQQS